MEESELNRYRQQHEAVKKIIKAYETDGDSASEFVTSLISEVRLHKMRFIFAFDFLLHNTDSSIFLVDASLRRASSRYSAVHDARYEV